MSRITQFGGLFVEAFEGRQIGDLSRPVPHEEAVVLASVKDKPDGGADAPSLTSAPRAGVLDEAAGTKEWGSAGGRTKEWGR